MTKIVIIGAGALGSLLAFYLSARSEVWLLDRWGEQVEAIAAGGVTCERAGQAETRAVRATTDAAAIGRCDAALIAVKSRHTRWAAEQAGKLPGAAVVTLQNGIGNRETLAAALGAERVGQGVTTLGATLLGLGRVRQSGHGTTVFGAQPDRAAAEQLAALFAASGLPAEVSDDLDALVWGKLVANAGINALSALLRVPNGALAHVPEAAALLEAAAREAAAVAERRGIRLPYDDPAAYALQVAQTTADNWSSMLQDVLRGRPTEIEEINGAVVREGERLGVPTPVNRALADLVRARDACARAGWSIEDQGA